MSTAPTCDIAIVSLATTNVALAGMLELAYPRGRHSMADNYKCGDTVTLRTQSFITSLVHIYDVLYPDVHSNDEPTSLVIALSFQPTDPSSNQSGYCCATYQTPEYF
jgi:hypothetical protein